MLGLGKVKADCSLLYFYDISTISPLYFYNVSTIFLQYLYYISTIFLLHLSPQVKPVWLAEIGTRTAEAWDGTSWRSIPSLSRAKVVLYGNVPKRTEIKDGV